MGDPIILRRGDFPPASRIEGGPIWSGSGKSETDCGSSRTLARSGAARSFLMVLGPFGSFSRRLGAALRATGARCERVLLNGGDVLDWGLRHGRPYYGTLDQFGDWFGATLGREGVTDVVLYGDAHPYCLAAADAARRLRRRVHVLEQGYFRPFWITLERDGVNGNTSLPRDPDTYRRAAAGARDPQDIWLPPLTPPAARKIFNYHAGVILGRPVFPHFHVPYEYSILHQGLGHARRYLGHKLSRRRDVDLLVEAMGAPGARYVAILQRPGDSQLRLHSPYGATSEFIAQVIESFAASAPQDGRLLFKAHPLDHGLEPHGQVIKAEAERRGVGRRVFFIDAGDLQAMLPGSAGAVTINSTAGLACIELGLPTIALGVAIYNMPGMTHQGDLDSFWTRPQKPDPDLYRDFRKVVIDRTQISGAYAAAKGVEVALPEATRRLLAD